PDLSPAPEPVIALTQTDAVSELSPAEVQADSIEGVKAVGMSSAPDTPMQATVATDGQSVTQAGPEPVLHSRVEPVSDWPIWQAAVEETAAQTQDNPMITQAASAEIVPGAPKGVGASVPSLTEATALPGKAYPRPNVYRVRRRVSPLSDRLFWKVASLAAM